MLAAMDRPKASSRFIFSDNRHAADNEAENECGNHHKRQPDFSTEPDGPHEYEREERHRQSMEDAHDQQADGRALDLLQCMFDGRIVGDRRCATGSASA